VEELIEILTHNATTWEKLLHLIGGKLELTKCKFTVYSWKMDEQGTMILRQDKQIGKISIMDSETNQSMEIEEIRTNKPYKLLGIPMAPQSPEGAQN
jgi:hypothetical protein